MKWIRRINHLKLKMRRNVTTKTDFGFQEVNIEEKEFMVKDVFSKVAQKYDIMNDLMSFGIHRLWKDEFVDMMGFKNLKISNISEIPRHLDVAGGTGDIAIRSANQIWTAIRHLPEKESILTDLTGNEKTVVVCDINPDMLAVGKDRASKVMEYNKSKMMGFVEGNAEKLPFSNDSFDFYTIAFGLRNVTNKEVKRQIHHKLQPEIVVLLKQIALSEAFRVLKSGGKLQILEFSHVQNPVLQRVYDEYSFRVIPPLGRAVAQDAASYQYLVESIRRFPKQDELHQMMQSAGFKYVSYKNMTFGVVAVHCGFKL